MGRARVTCGDGLLHIDPINFIKFAGAGPPFSRLKCSSVKMQSRFEIERIGI